MASTLQWQCFSLKFYSIDSYNQPRGFRESFTKLTLTVTSIGWLSGPFYSIDSYNQPVGRRFSGKGNVPTPRKVNVMGKRGSSGVVSLHWTGTPSPAPPTAVKALCLSPHFPTPTSNSPHTHARCDTHLREFAHKNVAKMGHQFDRFVTQVFYS